MISLRMQNAPWLALALLGAIGVGGCFPRHPGPRLAHFEERAPAAGEVAPAFRVTDTSGSAVELTDLLGERPVVLQLGSRSCPVFRYRRFGMEKLIADYADRVHFVVVYTIEAHPAGAKSPYDDEEWLTWINRLTGVRIEQAGDVEARRHEAAATAARLDLAQQVLVDSTDNEVWQAYGAAPSAAFVLDREGRVVLRQVWVDPVGLRAALDTLLEPW